MKMSLSIFYLVMLAIFTSCKYDKTFQDLPECVTDEISAINQLNLTAQIYQCKLSEETVYLIQYNQCCDWRNYLYSANCNQVCVYGGWSGYQCDSILNALTDKKLIFENP